MKKKKMVTNMRVLKRRLAALVLSLALVDSPAAVAGETEGEEEKNSGQFTLGNDWERESIVSYGFSDRSSHVSSTNSDRHSDWDSASQCSSSRPRNSRSQKLTDIVDLRRHIFKGNLEITPANFKGLLQFAKIHETAFNTYDKGVFVKEWKASLGFDSLLDILVKFNQPRTFKVTVNWDLEADASEVIARAVQFYKELTTLDIANCKLTDAGMQDIMESVAYPERLKELNIIGNSINDVTLKSLQNHFPNLISFKAGADIIPPRISQQLLSTQEQDLIVEPQSSTKRRRTQATILIEEDRLPADLLRKAAQGNAEAQYKIGIMYANGRGVAKDDVEAAKWYKKAAKQGYADAQNILGDMYANGRGVVKDDVKAIKWYKKAAKQRHAEAQNSLGIMYANGRGVAKDDMKAAQWCKKAAKKGNAYAQYNLSNMYAIGRGVAKNDMKAAQWCKKAAKKGNAYAQYNFGNMCAIGQGVAKDDVEAVKWCKKAAKQGYTIAQNSLGNVYMKGQMAPKSDKKAAKWYKKAAKQGYVYAQYNLGDMYANGRGVAKDGAEAIKWYKKAAKQGHIDAQSKLCNILSYGGREGSAT